MLLENQCCLLFLAYSAVACNVPSQLYMPLYDGFLFEKYTYVFKVSKNGVITGPPSPHPQVNVVGLGE